ncbi:MAG TPA: BON domain-containing protein [Candidatus Eremiobacteraceae bacterium]|nr:BON domain-containing protein [Candidatus Eremiobacteraceae bacterium]
MEARFIGSRALELGIAAVIAASIAGCGQNGADKARSAADDALLAAQVQTTIAGVDAATIGLVHVSSDNGVVTLTGKIANMSERAAMEKAARSVHGVETLDDQVVVDASAPTAKQIEADLTLSAQVHTALVAQTGVNAADIHVDVHRGVVTLTGHVPSPAHKAVADQTVRSVKGVTSVVDKLTIVK